MYKSHSLKAERRKDRRTDCNREKHSMKIRRKKKQRSINALFFSHCVIFDKELLFFFVLKIESNSNGLFNQFIQDVNTSLSPFLCISTSIKIFFLRRQKYSFEVVLRTCCELSDNLSFHFAVLCWDLFDDKLFLFQAFGARFHSPPNELC